MDGHHNQITHHGGMTHSGMTHGGMTHGGMTHGGMTHEGMTHEGMTHSGMTHGGMTHRDMTHGGMTHGGMTHGPCILYSKCTCKCFVPDASTLAMRVYIFTVFIVVDASIYFPILIISLLNFQVTIHLCH